MHHLSALQAGRAGQCGPGGATSRRLGPRGAVRARGRDKPTSRADGEVAGGRSSPAHADSRRVINQGRGQRNA